MFRTSLAGLLALFAAGAAHGDTGTLSLLTGGAWECRSVSLAGDPDSDVSLDYSADGSAGIVFRLQVPLDQDLLEVLFEMTARWTLADQVITTTAETFNMLGAWMNDEPLEDEAMSEMAAALETEMASFSGENEIAYLSEHAMVLSEPEASISCWRSPEAG
jgi:hypothetical protein